MYVRTPSAMLVPAIWRRAEIINACVYFGAFELRNMAVGGRASETRAPSAAPGCAFPPTPYRLQNTSLTRSQPRLVSAPPASPGGVKEMSAERGRGTYGKEDVPEGEGEVMRCALEDGRKTELWGWNGEWGGHARGVTIRDEGRGTLRGMYAGDGGLGRVAGRKGGGSGRGKDGWMATRRKPTESPTAPPAVPAGPLHPALPFALGRKKNMRVGMGTGSRNDAWMADVRGERRNWVGMEDGKRRATHRFNIRTILACPRGRAYAKEQLAAGSASRTPRAWIAVKATEGTRPLT
ncbi:hypothetical protein DFH09DRAFT_1084622 [Mycena vulgaris]|nr:hypothetical protein DFH09DRAFT_1084622 [Mycena vulgaris]